MSWTRTSSVGVPPDFISLWSGAVGDIPSGWTLCDGSDGTPDLTNRFVVGAGGSYSVEDTGGQDSVTLSTSQMPSHSHSFDTNANTSGGHSHNNVSASTNSDGSHSHGTNGMSLDQGGYHLGHATNSVSTDEHNGNYHKVDETTYSAGSHNHQMRMGGVASNSEKGGVFDGGNDGNATHPSTSNDWSHNHDISSGSTYISSAGEHSHNRVNAGTNSDGNHSHNITTNVENSGAHSHGISGSISGAGSHNHNSNVSTGSSGSSQSHENRPQYYALAYIMKTI